MQFGPTTHAVAPGEPDNSSPRSPDPSILGADDDGGADVALRAVVEHLERRPRDGDDRQVEFPMSRTEATVVTRCTWAALGLTAWTGR